ncbi:hypothetical protein HYV30_00455 [Candidatus Kaiserbacteria bacterium]|nr:hypothetical protein [Candidatus Kaiserbacteria bacterium]
MAAWSGGIFDPSRNRLVIWGGGHGDYAGNEIYAFDVNSLSWQRVTNPSTPYPFGNPPSNPVNSDGTPASLHTYDGLAYLPGSDSLFAVGGSKWPGGEPSNLTWTFNFGTSRWTKRADAPYPGVDLVTAYDPASGKVYAAGPFSNQPLIEYDPVNNVWTGRGDPIDYGGMNAAFDPVRKKMVVIGRGRAFAYNLNVGGFSAKQSISPGACAAGEAPGIAYDSTRDRIVAWSGGTKVCVLDPNSNSWTTIQAEPGNSVTPTAPVEAGTYGRFQYVPSKNAFILVNGVNQNVYAYKMP